MNEIITKDREFKDLVHVIRGQQVMLDSDLAKLYGTEVKKLIQQVKRNIDKFPDDFMFQLTMSEANESARSQNVTLNKQGKNIKYAPYVFTEQGVYMVATILKNEIATQQSIYIMRSFKEMKHYIVENQQFIGNEEILKLSNHIIDQDKRITGIETTMATKTDIDKIMENFIDDKKIKEKLFLNGQVFDAVEAYIMIYKQANKNIYIIDDYININTLSLLAHKQKNVDITIFTGNKSEPKLSKNEVKKFNIQYPSLSIRYTDKVHDRFIVIDYGTDNEKFYVCGSSSKDAGQKICTIIQLYDKAKLHFIIDELLKSKLYVF
ncbi:ORF6N domain-containing protein [Amedibacillus sp. YH-ame10]